MKSKGDLSKDYNYFIITERKMIFNNYKTKGIYQSQEIDINNILALILIEWVKKFKLVNKFLLQKSDGSELDKNGITKILYKIFNKKVGSSLLRNIYLTDKYSNLNKEKINDAKAMGNSVNVIDSNYVKID
jgi:hypothetical protein